MNTSKIKTKKKEFTWIYKMDRIGEEGMK